MDNFRRDNKKGDTQRMALKEYSEEEILERLEGYKLVEDCGGLEDVEKHEWVKFINKENGKFYNGGFVVKNRCPDHLLVRIPSKGGGIFCVIKPSKHYIYINEERHLQIKTDIADQELKDELFLAFTEGRLIETRTKSEAKQMKRVYKKYLETAKEN